MRGDRIHTTEAPRWEVWVGSGKNVSGTGGSRLSPTDANGELRRVPRPPGLLGPHRKPSLWKTHVVKIPRTHNPAENVRSRWLSHLKVYRQGCSGFQRA